MARRPGAGTAVPSATAPRTPCTARAGCAWHPSLPGGRAGNSGKAPSGPPPRSRRPQTSPPRPAQPDLRRIRLPRRAVRVRRRAAAVPAPRPARRTRPARPLVRDDPYEPVGDRGHPHRPHRHAPGVDLARLPRVHRPPGTPDHTMGLRARRLPRRQPHHQAPRSSTGTAGAPPPQGLDAATPYASSLLQPNVAARVRAAFPLLGSPAGPTAEATVCAMPLQTVACGDNVTLEDQLRDWSEKLRCRCTAP